MNALKHGLNYRKIVIPEFEVSDPPSFLELLLSLFKTAVPMQRHRPAPLLRLFIEQYLSWADEDIFNIDYESDAFFSNVSTGGIDTPNALMLREFLGKIMNIELTFSVWRGACHLQHAVEHKRPPASSNLTL